MLGPPQESWGCVLVGIGAVSGVLGVLFALAQHDLKSLLAYHSVENIGIITMGIGVGVIGQARHGGGGRTGFRRRTTARGQSRSLQGAALPCAGAVLHGAKTAAIDQLGGLGKKDAARGGMFPGWVSGDQWAAALQRVCERIPDLPRRVRRRPRFKCNGRHSGAGDHRVPWAYRRSGGGVFRQGIRDCLPWRAAKRGRSRRT